MGIDYESESLRLEAFKPEEGGKFWKPKPGQYKVRSLTELEDAEPFIDESGVEKPQAKIELQLLSDDTEVTWTMAIGKSPASAYGQLISLAKLLGNSLKQREFMVVVTNDGKKNSYTVVKL